MTREEAIELIESARKTMYLPKSKEYISDLGYALEMAIKALEQSYNSIKTELKPCDDAISRQAAIELVADYDLSMGQVVKGIHALPPVNPQPKADDAISRQAAIEAFQMFREYYSNRSNKEWVNRIETVLNQLPPVTPQYTEDEIQKMQDLEQMEIEKAYELGKVEKQECEDTISRQAVNTLIDELARAISDERCCLSRGRSTATIMRDILHLPPVIPQPKVGRWIYGEDNSGTGRDGWYCNQCGHFEFWDYSSDMKSAELNLPNLCPNCKAKMQEVKDDKRRN